MNTTVHGNQFTREYWRGDSKTDSLDYVTNSYPGPVYHGRIGGTVTTDQQALKALYYQLIEELYTPQGVPHEDPQTSSPADPN